MKPHHIIITPLVYKDNVCDTGSNKIRKVNGKEEEYPASKWALFYKTTLLFLSDKISSKCCVRIFISLALYNVKMETSDISLDRIYQALL